MFHGGRSTPSDQQKEEQQRTVSKLHNRQGCKKRRAILLSRPSRSHYQESIRRVPHSSEAARGESASGIGRAFTGCEKTRNANVSVEERPLRSRVKLRFAAPEGRLKVARRVQRRESGSSSRAP